MWSTWNKEKVQFPTDWISMDSVCNTAYWMPAMYHETEGIMRLKHPVTFIQMGSDDTGRGEGCLHAGDWGSQNHIKKLQQILRIIQDNASRSGRSIGTQCLGEVIDMVKTEEIEIEEKTYEISKTFYQSVVREPSPAWWYLSWRPFVRARLSGKCYRGKTDRGFRIWRSQNALTYRTPHRFLRRLWDSLCQCLCLHHRNGRGQVLRGLLKALQSIGK